jgi:anti-sigma regulatory factor (Ser/Thr protein kinase)
MLADHNGATDAGTRFGGPGQPARGLAMALPTAPQAARMARQATLEALVVWRLGHLADIIVLLVSELVTNAVRHARPESAGMELRLEAAGGTLRIEVEDGDPRWPQPRTLTGPEESGFGFVLVDALASKWGVRDTAAGKAVWVELDIDPGGG